MNDIRSFTLILYFLGLILMFGNVTGLWITFPYAGSITLFIAFLISKIIRYIEEK